MSSATQKRPSVDELRSIVAPVAERYGVDKVYLFGSAARGDHGEKSDYDFCIELGRIRDLFALSEFFQDLRDAVGYEIDLVDMKAAKPDLLGNILSEGVILYEK
jgi:predicted nucleotidyltransferase